MTHFRFVERGYVLEAQTVGLMDPKMPLHGGMGQYTVRAACTIKFSSKHYHSISVGSVLLHTGLSFDAVMAVGQKLTIKRIAIRLPAMTRDQLNKQRTVVTVEVVRQMETERGPFNFGTRLKGSLVVVANSMCRVLARVPGRHRAKARCQIASEYLSGDADSVAVLRVSYDRLESDAEIRKRLRTALLDKIIAEQNERRTLAHLAAKYPNTRHPHAL